MAVFPPIMKPPHTWGAPPEVTIASGVAALSGEGSYLVDTEADAASDDLDKLTGLVEGDEVVLKAANNARTVVLKNGAYLKIGADFSLNNQYDTITLLCIGSDTCVVKGGRASGG